MTTTDPKIIDLLQNKKDGDILVSLEYFPPRTEAGVQVRVCLRVSECASVTISSINLSFCVFFMGMLDEG
jgi:hypothetical protein